MQTTHAPKVSPAFYFQAITSFTVSLSIVIIGEVCLPLSAWTRAFLAIGTLFLVSSSFTLAKVVRDQQETDTSIGWHGQPPIEQPAEVDPFWAPR